MKLKRVDTDLTVKEAKTIDITIGEVRYRLTESFGKLNINKSDNSEEMNDTMAIYPCVSNVIEIK